MKTEIGIENRKLKMVTNFQLGGIMPTLAILTDTIRYDNQAALRYFNKIKPVHFYKSAPYGDFKKEDLKGTIKYENFTDLSKKIFALKPDIIQGAEPYGSRTQLRLCQAALKISKKLNIPLIFPMLENKSSKKRFGPILGPVLRRILAKYARQANLIFYLNNGAKRNLLEAGVEPKKLKKMLYGIWGVDCGLFKPESAYRISHIGKGNDAISNKRLAISEYILFVGRLDEAKGISYILQAWGKIKDEFSKIKLIFIGTGENPNLVRGTRVKRLGRMKTKDLPPYFANALFTLYPSVTLPKWEEQVGMVNLQSLACGTPVITTKSGAIPEYVNDKVGILVPERDAEALAQAMRKLLKNSQLRQKLGKNGRKYILENFDAQKTVEKAEEILLGLLK